MGDPNVQDPGDAQRRAFSVAIYVRRGERVLVIEHRRLQTWLPIGGELEPGEIPIEAARRELSEETGLTGCFRPLVGARDGVPPGLIGYEEHQAGSKGLHMNFVFVTEVATDAEVAPNDEFGVWRWIDRRELADLRAPINVRQFGALALEAVLCSENSREILQRTPSSIHARTEQLEQLAMRIGMARISYQTDPYVVGLAALSRLIERYLGTRERFKNGPDLEFAVAHRDYTIAEQELRLVLARAHAFSDAGRLGVPRELSRAQELDEIYAMARKPCGRRSWLSRIWRRLTWR